ncbi:MAG: DUF4080 domain-containing protein [Spirochaetaceae bacterium]|nr:DUF4080 domain-containing protein [Spirochaetaceae bacterium]
MKILLAVINAKWVHPSLALRLLKANLGEYEAGAEIIEFTLRQSFEEKRAAVLAADPRVLGVSVSIWNHLPTLELLKGLETAWTARGQKPAVVLGGPEVSWLPSGSELFRYADFVIQGEGEIAFRELCRTLFAGDASFPAVPGTAGPRFIDGVSAPPETLKTAYHYYTARDLGQKLTYVEASRGCPHRCAFCLGSASPVSGGAVREFPLEPFLREMDALIARGARNFKFLDRTFNYHPERAGVIMEFFLKRTMLLRASDPGDMLRVHFEITPAPLPRAIREILARFPPGTLRLEVGIQTFNTKTAVLIRRPLDVNSIAETLAFLSGSTNAIIHADLIAALPGEGLESFGAGFDKLWIALTADNPPGKAEIQVGILKLLPGAAVLRRSDQYGMKYAALPPYEALETAALTREELNRIKNFARFWELIVNRDTFPDLAPVLVPKGEAVFSRFMGIAGRLFARFGRNWGLDRRELRAALAEEASGPRA